MKGRGCAQPAPATSERNPNSVPDLLYAVSYTSSSQIAWAICSGVSWLLSIVASLSVALVRLALLRLAPLRTALLRLASLRAGCCHFFVCAVEAADVERDVS